MAESEPKHITERLEMLQRRHDELDSRPPALEVPPILEGIRGKPLKISESPGEDGLLSEIGKTIKEHKTETAIGVGLGIAAAAAGLAATVYEVREHKKRQRQKKGK